MEPLSRSDSLLSVQKRENQKTMVLVVDDDPGSLVNLQAALQESGYRVLAAQDGIDAVSKLKQETVDVIVSDVRMEGMNGMELLDHVSKHSPETALILVTGFGTIESAVAAMQKGAYDYLTKPVDVNKLELLIEKAVRNQKLFNENVRLKKELSEKYSFGSIVGRSAPMRKIFDQIEQVAKTSATVLIQGESGTGKELIASALHHNSSRAGDAFIKVNCVAFVEGLIESELFGHEKGSFTGAYKTRKGRIESADGGTLFLDEIGDLGLTTQLKLLRVLQEREIERVGGNMSIPVDVRLIAATNKNLEQEVALGRFREELYYRIKVVTIQVPPLRERAEDVPLLVDHFVQIFNREHGKAVEGFGNQALKTMMRYSWPGNVRELRNIVETLVVMTKTHTIEQKELPRDILENQGTEDALTVPIGITLAEAERRLILGSLHQNSGNKAGTARMLGIGKKTLYRKLKDYGMLEEESTKTAEKPEE